LKWQKPEGEAEGVTVGATFSRAARTRRGVAGIFVGLAGAGLAISAAFAGTSAPAKGVVAKGVTKIGRQIPASAVARLDVIAIRAAKANGDARPQWITVVRTTHGTGLKVATPGDTEPSGNGVSAYLITMKGTFTAYEASVPAGASRPRGQYLSLLVNARSFRVTDVGLSGHPPPKLIATLGPVKYLRR
jgi:hypothetical protein